MRFSQTQMALPAYYDRRSKMLALYYVAELVGPHVPTMRVYDTVPSDANAFLENVTLLVCRDVAGATPGIAGAWVTYVDPASNEVPVASIRGTLSTPGTSIFQAVSPHIFLLPETEVRIYTRDASVGGSHTFHVGVSIVYWPR